MLTFVLPGSSTKTYAFPRRNRFAGLQSQPRPQHQPWPQRTDRKRKFDGVRAVAISLPQPTTSPWGIWAGLTFAGAAGLWSEKTRIGKELSGPLVSTLVGLCLSNIYVIPYNAPQYSTVNRFLLPLAVPLLLFTADLRRILRDTGKLLGAFCIGSLATVAGTLVAMKLLPLRSLGPDSWKVASALCARHIGGAINYVGVAETLQLGAAAQAAGLAADNLLCALYFATLFQLARRIPPDAPVTSQADVPAGVASASQESTVHAENAKPCITVLEGSTALALSTVLCYMSSQLAVVLGYSSALIPLVTVITVTLATLAPGPLAPLVASGEGIAAILLHIFFAAVGANASVAAVVQSCPALFVFCFLQIGVHLGLTLGFGRLAGFSRRDLLLASNANVGGPTTAAGMAAAKGWRLSLVPSLLVGTFGYAVATFLACILGGQVLQHM